MKKMLLDPSKNYYKANMHCHSTKSDGNLSVEELKEYYKAKGYSIIAFSEHEHLINNSHLNDDEFLAITSCELAIKEYAHLYPSTKRDMKVCHLNLYAKEPDNVDIPCYNSKYSHQFLTDLIKDEIVHTCGEYERVYSAEGISEIIRIASEKGFLVSYNHPKWSLENATDYLGYKGLWGVEIYNHGSWVMGFYEYDINAYEDFLRDGQRLACVVGDDNHNKRQDSFGGYVMINAPKLEYKAIIEAMENHNLYTSMGPVIHELYVEDNVAHITVEKAKDVIMSTKGRRIVKKQVKNSQDKNSLEFEIMPDDVYIRFDIVDEEGKRANTCAYFIED